MKMQAMAVVGLSTMLLVSSAFAKGSFSDVSVWACDRSTSDPGYCQYARDATLPAGKLLRLKYVNCAVHNIGSQPLKLYVSHNLNSADNEVGNIFVKAGEMVNVVLPQGSAIIDNRKGTAPVNFTTRPLGSPVGEATALDYHARCQWLGSLE